MAEDRGSAFGYTLFGNMRQNTYKKLCIIPKKPTFFLT